MRKGYRREAGSEGSAKQRCEPMDKNRIQGASAGRAGNVSRSPYPSFGKASEALQTPDERSVPVESRSYARKTSGPIASEEPAAGLVGSVCRRWPKRNDTLPRATASWLT